MGTSLGITALYQAAAITLNQHGKLITLEGDETMSSLAKRNSQLLGLDNVLSIVTDRFQDTLNSVLNEHGPVDYVFVDADKDEKTVLEYFEEIYPFLSSRAVLVFDDIYWSNGMEKAWKAIESGERVQTSVDLRALGVCIVDRGLNRKERFRIPVG
jgi:predicted O-methyltransferase YrrM